MDVLFSSWLQTDNLEVHNSIGTLKTNRRRTLHQLILEDNKNNGRSKARGMGYGTVSHTCTSSGRWKRRKVHTLFRNACDDATLEMEWEAAG